MSRLFVSRSKPPIESALHRAIGLWHFYPGEFRKLMIHGMSYDYSSGDPSRHHRNIYEYIRHK